MAPDPLLRRRLPTVRPGDTPAAPARFPGQRPRPAPASPARPIARPLCRRSVANRAGRHPVELARGGPWSLGRAPGLAAPTAVVRAGLPPVLPAAPPPRLVAPPGSRPALQGQDLLKPPATLRRPTATA